MQPRDLEKERGGKKKNIFSPMMIFWIFSFFRHGLVEGVRQTAHSVVDDHHRDNARHAVASPHAHPARQQKEKREEKKIEKICFFSLFFCLCLVQSKATHWLSPRSNNISTRLTIGNERTTVIFGSTENSQVFDRWGVGESAWGAYLYAVCSSDSEADCFVFATTGAAPAGV
jgi:hypothetical protein